MKRKIHFIGCILFAALATVAFYIFSQKVFPKPFYTNDQMLMRDFASGKYSGFNDGHLVYILYPLGFILAKLYSVFPNIGWYNLLMFGTFFVVFFCIVLKLTRMTKSIALNILVTFTGIVAFVGCCPLSFNMNEYTIDAGLWGALGIFYLFPSYGEGKKGFIVRNIISIFALLMSLCIRKEVFFMSAPFIIMVFAFKMFNKSIRKGDYAVGAALLISVCVLMVIDCLAYSSAEWKEYKQFNEARTKIVDFNEVPPYEENAGFYQSIGMDKIEVEALFSGLGLITNLDGAKLEKIAELSEERVKENVFESKEDLLYSIRKELSQAKKQPIGLLIVIICLAIMTFSFVGVVNSKEKKYLWYGFFTCGTIAYIFAFIVYFLYKNRFPYRVSQSLYIMAILFLTGLLLRCVDEIEFCKVFLYAMSFCVAVALVISVKLGWGRQLTNMRDNSEVWRSYIEEAERVYNYCEEHSDNLYFLDYTVSNFMTDYLVDNTYQVSENAIVTSFWVVDSPLIKERLKNVGIESMLDTLLNGQNVYYIFRSEYGQGNIGELCEYYGQPISFALVDKLQGVNGDIEIYKVNHQE